MIPHCKLHRWITQPILQLLCLFQIADLLDTDSRNLKNCSVREGSVIVSMNVEGYDELEAAELEKATEDLQQMISEGQVGFVYTLLSK